MIIISIAHFIIGIYILLSSGLLITVILRTRTLREYYPNTFILSLAFADASIGVVSFILASWHYDMPVFDECEGLCVGMFAAIVTVICCSMLNMILIAVDRYLFIFRPFFYYRIMSTKTALAAILGVWTLSVAYGSVPFYNNRFSTSSTCDFYNVIPIEFRAYSNSVIYLFGMVTTAGVYTAIGWAAASHQAQIMTDHHKAIKRLSRRAQSDSTSGSTATTVRQSILQRHYLSKLSGRARYTSQMKSFKMFFLVFGLFALCWTPYSVVLLLNREEEHIYMTSFTRMLGFFNAGTTVFVLSYINRQFHKALLRFLTCGRHVHVSSVSWFSEADRRSRSHRQPTVWEESHTPTTVTGPGFPKHPFSASASSESGTRGEGTRSHTSEKERLKATLADTEGGDDETEPVSLCPTIESVSTVEVDKTPVTQNRDEDDLGTSGPSTSDLDDRTAAIPSEDLDMKK